MSITLQMVLAVEGMFMSSLPPGQLVTSRADCVSTCYSNHLCFSVFYDSSSMLCYPVGAVYTVTHMDTTAGAVQYLTWQPDRRVCQQGYDLEADLNLCYKIHTTVAVWQTAENKCIQDGGHLLKVDSLAENVFSFEHCREMGMVMWLGGSDILEEGTWIWGDNSAMINATSSWYPGEPNAGLEDEDCAALVCDGAQGVWYDRICNREYAYICETHLINSFAC